MNLQMIATTLSSANQTAVPARIRKKMNLKTGDRLVWEMKEDRIYIKILPKYWGSYMKGLGQEIWKEVDVENYIKDGRKDRQL